MIQSNYENLSQIFSSLTIVECYRSFTINSSINIPDNLISEESDGSVFMVLSNGKVFGFYANTEEFTITVNEINFENIPINSINVFNNKFWEKVQGKKIIKVESLYNILETPYGIKFGFENDIDITLLYVSESEYTFDALIIR